jgi:hypothetical protein
MNTFDEEAWDDETEQRAIYLTKVKKKMGLPLEVIYAQVGAYKVSRKIDKDVLKRIIEKQPVSPVLRDYENKEKEILNTIYGKYSNG